MKIYTRTGDKGQTSLIDGTRVLKSHIRVNSYGAIDELNSQIGLVRSFLNKSTFKEINTELEQIQNDLFVIGAALATPDATPVAGIENRSKEFEGLIDTMTSELPPLKNFILPSGGKTGSLLHIARTIARRAERQIIELIQQEDIDSNIVVYVNRLSDLLFTMARYVNHKEQQQETIWNRK